MAEIVRMPKLSDTMTDGVVAKWHKKVGDPVKEGDLLAEIETDKATMEFESFVDGTLLYIGVPEKGTAPVDAILAIFGKKGEDFSSLLSDKKNANSKEEVTKETVTENKEVTPNPIIDTSNIKATVIKMPKLSDTMTDGVVAKWHKKVGDTVKEGDLLAEIETDKATMEFESFEDGILLYTGIDEGSSAPVNAVLAVIGEKNADFKTLIENSASSSEKDTSLKSDKENTKTAEAVTSTTKTLTSTPQQHTLNNNSRTIASPLAKKLAAERNINLSILKGSGDHGRIIKSDIENYQGGTASNFVGTEKSTEVATSQMRKTIARRLAESKFSAPHFYLTIEINMDKAIEARTAINGVASVKISFNDFVIKAVAESLKKHPNVNTSWLGDRIRYNEHVNIGVAVAVEDGLLVPVVRFADGKTLSQISTEVREFAQKAKDKKLQPQDWEGSTFTISNLGMFGIDEFTAIINPPDACIMAVGGIKETPVVKNGQIVPGNVMKVTLSCDHRVVDGATGASFLQTFKYLLENPVILLGAQNI
ncbi:MAG: pyruvate dehydrogenase complex dihydrolipoamide acetyltransferase [Bacteroidetes bacterium HGW-Bacteroidetes-12]|nr:MAG: pyruvate dehydrogenase complex dihydrolipoamide acetyltransferase [Bacteroidetes bacterium HGW-Bacteroidetes-12]